MPVALSARIFGGEPGKPTLGIWLYHNRSEFGLPPLSNSASSTGATRTGSSLAATPWRDSLSEDRLTAIKQVRGYLLNETDPTERHYLYNTLEGYLYASREVFESALTEFEAVCTAHHDEMAVIRPALAAEFGGLPLLPMYRQMAIMKEKAHLYAEALTWAEKGLAVYGDDCPRSRNFAKDDHRNSRLI